MRIAASFFGMFVGWCAAIVALVCRQVFASGYGYVTDFRFFLFWPAFFGFIGWFLFVAPAVRWVRDDHPVMRLPWIVGSGAVYGLLAYGILVCSWFPGFWIFAWFPAIMGGVAGATYGLLRRSSALARAPRAAAFMLVTAPVVLVVLFAFVAWPLTIRRAPYVAYVFGAPRSREAAELQIVRSIRTGETYAELRRRYPRLFSEPVASRWSARSRYTYTIEFDDTRNRVVAVTIREHGRSG